MYFFVFYVFLCCYIYCLCSMYFCVVLCIAGFATFCVLFVCVLNYCHRVATQLQLNIPYHISYQCISYLLRRGNHVNVPLFSSPIPGTWLLCLLATTNLFHVLSGLLSPYPTTWCYMACMPCWYCREVNHNWMNDAVCSLCVTIRAYVIAL
jgi:hypothetical protein